MRVLGYRAARRRTVPRRSRPATQANPLSNGGVVDLRAPYGGVDARWSCACDAGGRAVAMGDRLAWMTQRQHRRGYENFVGGDARRARRAACATRRRVDASIVRAGDVGPGDRWSLTAGVRHSRVRFRSEDHYITARNPDDSGGRTYSATSPVFGASWRANDALHCMLIRPRLRDADVQRAATAPTAAAG